MTSRVNVESVVFCSCKVYRLFLHLQLPLARESRTNTSISLPFSHWNQAGRRCHGCHRWSFHVAIPQQLSLHAATSSRKPGHLLCHHCRGNWWVAILKTAFYNTKASDLLVVSYDRPNSSRSGPSCSQDLLWMDSTAATSHKLSLYV